MKETKDLSFVDMMKQVLSGDRECLHTPNDPVEAGEVVLGVLEDPIARSLFSFKTELTYSYKKFRSSVPNELSDDKKELEKLHSQVHQFENRLRCANAVFWECVYSDFPAARAPTLTVAIREGWQVVVFKSQPTSLLDFLMG